MVLINLFTSVMVTIDQFITLICAGHDTTAYFSSYTAYLLATNPKVQDRLVDEILTQLNGFFLLMNS